MSDEQNAPSEHAKSDRRVFAIVVIGALVLGGWWISHRNSGSSVHLSLPATRHVTYKVDGSARSADITYQTPSGSSQQNGVDVPLTKKSDHTEGIEFDTSMSFLYISAQNQGGGTITCHILVDGIEVATNTASGDYAIATCTA